MTVTTRRTRVRLHSELSSTTVWGYDGRMPGPTIEVRRDEPVRIRWRNGTEGRIPLTAVQQPSAALPATSPGYRNPDGTLQDGVDVLDEVGALPAWNVVHLHGARTSGGNDGWAHNAVLHGASQLAEYPNGQEATALWYHDHAMAITRFNVHAGLAGMYLIRDEDEDRLRLPHGEHEIPLVLRDCNLDTDPQTGELTGDLLWKVPVLPNGAVLPFTGPFNLVNGVIWPHLDVEPRWYRFRVLNTAGARPYRLDLVDDDGITQQDAVRIIGTDGGLLPRPVRMPEDGLTLHPSERADILIDFGALRGRNVRLTDLNAAGGPTEPDLMEFRVGDRPVKDRFELPSRLSSSYFRLEHGTTLPEHDHVFVGLVPPGSAGEAHPQMWELAEVTDPAQLPPSFPAEGWVQLTDPSSDAVRTFRTVARVFDDTTTFFLDHGRWVIWNLVHLGGPTHPVHIHLAEFQLLTRQQYALTAPGGAAVGFDVAAGGTTAPLPAPGPGRAIEDYEIGWKDTFQLRAGEWATVVGQMVGGTGDFMYHCHILDHEDEGMMRPFVVHPPEVAQFHTHPGSGGHDH
ncbi:multicopper oxidase [Luteipulveratus halotolerans]|uniref:Multicopper oxidase n=1 Tax=Luteipulveratus halotolerans TaxID=1631356 RepID=A0A0L6CP75_9MICO|nr:multicopper oxidase [Luteipulveratus halotolerans]